MNRIDYTYYVMIFDLKDGFDFLQGQYSFLCFALEEQQKIEYETGRPCYIEYFPW